MSRLATHVWIGAIRRLAESEGGTATVIVRGDRDAGDLLLLTRDFAGNEVLYRPEPWGAGWQLAAAGEEIAAQVTRARSRDRDLWILELAVANPERFIVSLPARD